jgi:hypothetical protein
MLVNILERKELVLKTLKETLVPDVGLEPTTY